MLMCNVVPQGTLWMIAPLPSLEFRVAESGGGMVA